jgi:hypothetical protein
MPVAMSTHRARTTAGPGVRGTSGTGRGWATARSVVGAGLVQAEIVAAARGNSGGNSRLLGNNGSSKTCEDPVLRNYSALGN